MKNQSKVKFTKNQKQKIQQFFQEQVHTLEKEGRIGMLHLNTKQRKEESGDVIRCLAFQLFENY